MDGADSTNAAPSGVRGACPAGWHLPSDTEWGTLATFVDGDNGADGVGKSLKATTGWNSGTSTDAYDFAALPGGTIVPAGPLSFGAGDNGYWWTTRALSGTHAWHRDLSGATDGMLPGNDPKEYGMSVRCVKD